MRGSVRFADDSEVDEDKRVYREQYDPKTGHPRLGAPDESGSQKVVLYAVESN